MTIISFPVEGRLLKLSWSRPVYFSGNGRGEYGILKGRLYHRPQSHSTPCSGQCTLYTTFFTTNAVLLLTDLD